MSPLAIASPIDVPDPTAEEIAAVANRIAKEEKRATSSILLALPQ